MSFLRDTMPFVALVVSLVLWIWSSRDDENLSAKGAIRKFLLYVEGLIFMLTAKDSKGIGKKLEDPDLIQQGTDIVFKRVVFIRHGESDWNDVFK